MRRIAVLVALAAWVLLARADSALAQERAAGRKGPPPPLLAGVAERDITPPPGLPMWGYGARHAALAEGALDPLRAKALVLSVGEEKLALVSLDLGRGPTALMMVEIRRRAAELAGVDHVIVSGSHTHHGPVIELTDREGRGRGTFDAAVKYARELPEMIVAAIVEAASSAQPARLGVAKRETTFNRNRHTKRTPKTTDPLLTVLRVDDLEGRPLMVAVSFAAHPVMTDPRVLKYSADWPGFMQAKVERELGAKCMFLQGASGDMSPHRGDLPEGPQPFGEAVAETALELARGVTTVAPPKPSLAGRTETFVFGSRVEFGNSLIQTLYSQAFFPELVSNFTAEMATGIAAELNVVLLNGDLALVSGSGEFFSNHAVRLRQRAYVDDLIFVGYANGHSLYFPTIEAASESGYGADPQVAPAEIGAGERIMDRALVLLYGLTGKFPLPEPRDPLTGR